jgi:hypothetical protein
MLLRQRRLIVGSLIKKCSALGPDVRCNIGDLLLELGESLIQLVKPVEDDADVLVIALGGL